ncbi:RraA family protein [Aurantiacibacter gilvus]|uniref:Putative 4-hydroxy-4-methyl-2-oxoglutarate aldolase n=1 Tax=Aurantiacibacter gilvus TaxID=3139141 RepID=A0ABU9IFH5_9SPHN
MELTRDTDIVTQLLKFDSCTLSDALDRLGLVGGISGLVPIIQQRRVAGRIFTVRLEPGPPPAGAPVRHLGAAAIDACGPGDIIVVSQRAGIDAGAWGGLLSNAAVRKGIAGVIVDGALRDVDEARELGLPIFCRRFTPFTARGRVYEAESGGPLALTDSFTVTPGYFALADGSGCVFVAPQDVDAVLREAEFIGAREQAMLTQLAAGATASEVMGASYENMLKGDFNE